VRVFACGSCVRIVRADCARELECTRDLCGAEENECFDPVVWTTFSCKLTHSKGNEKRYGAQGQPYCKVRQHVVRIGTTVGQIFCRKLQRGWRYAR